MREEAKEIIQRTGFYTKGGFLLGKINKTKR